MKATKAILFAANTAREINTHIEEYLKTNPTYCIISATTICTANQYKGEYYVCTCIVEKEQ